MPDQPDLADDLLRGGAAIAEELFGENDHAATRRVYHEQFKWPIWSDGGVLYALRSSLRAHAAAKSRAAEARLTAAAAKALTDKLSKPKRGKAAGRAPKAA